MSQNEALRPEVIRRVLESALAQAPAALLLGPSVLQVKRLCRRMHQHGAKGWVSQRRGRPSNRRVAIPQREHCLNLVREQQASGALVERFSPPPRRARYEPAAIAFVSVALGRCAASARRSAQR